MGFGFLIAYAPPPTNNKDTPIQKVMVLASGSLVMKDEIATMPRIPIPNERMDDNDRGPLFHHTINVDPMIVIAHKMMITTI